MKNFIYLGLIFVTGILQSCKSKIENPEILVNNAIQSHGLHELSNKSITFDFRDISYSMYRTDQNYIYTRTFEDSLGKVVDSVFNSSKIRRHRNDSLVNLDEEWSNKYLNSVNSVLYFFQVPFILKDPAAKKLILDQVNIEGQPYYSLKITFSEENGGEDFEDEYRYWIHTEKYTVDYLAYNYQTEGGGTRFRKAINRREINSLTFQDYINFKPETKFPPLDSLPMHYEKGKLKEVSRITNQNIIIN